MKLQLKFKNTQYANFDVEVRAKGFLVASIYWANEDGKLPNWSAIAAFPIEPSGIGKYRFEGNRAIPKEATHIYAKCVSSDFSTTDEALVGIPKEFQFNDDELLPVESLFVMSDLHLSSKTGKIIRAINSADSSILIAGDLVNDGYEEQFRLWQSCVEEYANNKLVLSVTGNHDQLLKDTVNNDYFGYEKFQEYLLNRTEALGYTCSSDSSGAYSVAYNNIDIIGLQCVSAKRKFGISKEQLIWLEKHLSENDNFKWHIIMCHAPLLAHNPHRNDGAVYFGGNDKLQNIIDRNKNIIFISGHTHYSPNTKQGSVQYISKSNTVYIDDGSIVPTELKGEALMPNEWHDGVAIELKIFDNALEIAYKSISNEMYHPRGYYRLMR